MDSLWMSVQMTGRKTALEIAMKQLDLSDVISSYFSASTWRESCQSGTLSWSLTYILYRVIPSRNKEDVSLLRDYISLYSNHSNQLLWKGRALVSTFAGESSLFGHDMLNDAWTYVKKVLEESFPVLRIIIKNTFRIWADVLLLQIHLIPSFFVDPNTYPDLTCMDGYFNVSRCKALWRSDWGVAVEWELADPFDT